MIECEFYIDARFEHLARLLESVTSRYHSSVKADVVQLGKRTYITLQGAIPDYTRGSIIITGAQVTEDDEGNVVLIHPNLPMIEFHTVAVRETRLKVTACCNFESVLLWCFKEILDEIDKAYPEAKIAPLDSNAIARATLIPLTISLLQDSRKLEKQFPGAMAWSAEYCGFTIEEAEELLALYETGQSSSKFEILKGDTMCASTLPEYKRRALENQRAALLEEYEAANAQLSRELSDVNRKRIERQIADLERQIAEIDARLQGTPAPQISAPANPLGPEPVALQMARRSLAILETQVGAYAMSEVPTHLQLNLEEKRKQVEELEARWRAGKL